MVRSHTPRGLNPGISRVTTASSLAILAPVS